MRNKLAFCIIATFIIFGLSGCRKKSEIIVLKLGHSLDTKHPVHKAMVFMAKRLAEKSNGKVRLDIYPSEQLGSEREMIEQVQMGSLDMTKTSTSPLESFIPIMGAFGVPYIFTDSEHHWKVLDGPIGERIKRAGESVGLKGLCFYDAGSRSFYTTDKPTVKPEDLEGMKIRVQESKTAMAMVEALGASPTPIAWGELYTSLQQGVVDGAENNPPSFYRSRHYEVCKHYSLDEHTTVPDIVLISMEVWNKLDVDVQRMVQEAAAESAQHQRELWKEMTAEALEEVEAAGVKIYHPDKEPFREKVKEMHESYKGTEIGDLIEEIKQAK
jgi:tripartite ATP-independent transporter DctP family solute receptor